MAQHLLLSATAAANSIAAEIGVSTSKFRYAELGADGAVLDTEQGSLNGLNFRLTKNTGSFEVEASGRYQRGQVDYAGKTNLGAPHFTRTHEAIDDLSLRAGWWLGSTQALMPYVGLGLRDWERDIAPTTNVGGLNENYRWKYAWVGAKVMAYQRETSHVIVDIGAIKPMRPVIDTDFKGSFNAAPRVYPVSRSGLRVLLTSRWALTNQVSLIAEPFLEYWYLHRSPSVTTGNLTIHEPASETKNYGLSLRLGMLW